MMPPVPIWMVMLAGLGVFLAGGVVGFWAGDTSQAVLTAKAETEAERQKRAAAEQALAVTEATAAEQVRQIAILEQTQATGALLAARLARDEARALQRARELEDVVHEVTDKLKASRAARDCPCRFTDADLRELRSLDRPITREHSGRRAGEGTQGSGPVPPR